MFPNPPAAPLKRRCLRCGKPVLAGRLIAGGWGVDCAQQLGLIPAPGRIDTADQDGPDLFDHLEGDPT